VSTTVLPYYDDGTDDERYRLWQQLAYVAAGVMFLALFFISHGSGDPAELAIGYGMLGALTVAGSAAAEAYATNDAAKQRTLAERLMAECAEELIEFEELEQNSAFAGSDAATTELAARHSALATAATVTVTANRLPDAPEVAGYIDGGHIPTTAPMSTPAQVLPQQAPRSKVRGKYCVIGDLLIVSDQLSAETNPSPTSTESAISRPLTNLLDSTENQAGVGGKHLEGTPRNVDRSTP
jgi:hypothetical protein